MASITIRKLEESLKRKLRVRAAQRDHSMEDEARDILRAALAQESAADEHLADVMHKRSKPFGGFDLTLPKRGPAREPPDFS
jgi:antitoxin FitA